MAFGKDFSFGKTIRMLSMYYVYLYFCLLTIFGFEARLGPDSGHCLPLHAWEVGKQICFVLSVRPSERKNEMG